jgi:hypothetical protein
MSVCHSKELEMGEYDKAWCLNSKKKISPGVEEKQSMRPTSKTV